MAFSLRKMLSNITYFKKPGDDDNIGLDEPLHGNDSKHFVTIDKPDRETTDTIKFERTEPDSTSKQATSLNLPDSIKNFAAKKGSLSDTDILTISIDSSKKEKRRKKLGVDIKKANSSNVTYSDSDNVENTPKHIHLDGQNSDIFSERIKRFNLNQSFDISDCMSDEASLSNEENLDIESLSDSDISLASNPEEQPAIQMCRKVSDTGIPGNDSSNYNLDSRMVPSASIESFADVELERTEEERIGLLQNYQVELEKIECYLNKLLKEFQFHIQVSKVFYFKSIYNALPSSTTGYIPKDFGEVIMQVDNASRGPSPTGSWNVVMEKEDCVTKDKLNNQLWNIKKCIEKFISNNLSDNLSDIKKKPKLTLKCRSITFDVQNGQRMKQKYVRNSNKKKLKRFDFPDIRDAMLNLFTLEKDKECNNLNANTTSLSDCSYQSDVGCCGCHCHMRSTPSQTDSGLLLKSNERSLSITSSLGNFSLDSSTLTAYSESLDQIISYNSFEDTSLYNTLLQKAAIERITFYVQVHSIQLKCETTDQDYESKNIIMFHCPSCITTENEENGLLKHILSQKHCEKIHFLYKTAYIKKCVQSGKEIQPSTVLNPMKMYRDDNKIVCFGDAVYACSLCFENLIVGESILMTHCSDPEHLERKEKLSEILE